MQIDLLRDGHFRELRDIEDEVIRRAVAHYRSKNKAARQLGIGRSTLYRRLEEMNDRRDAE